MRYRNFSRQQGFTLIEMVIVMAVLGIAIGGMLYWQSQATKQQKVMDAKTALIGMIGKVREKLSNNGNYSSVTATNLVRSGIVSQPYSASGSTIMDPWGNTVSVFGSPVAFGFVMKFPDSDACTSFLSSMAKDAAVIRGGSRITPRTSATAIGSVLSGGTIIKAGPSSSYSVGSAASVCNNTSYQVGLAFR